MDIREVPNTEFLDTLLKACKQLALACGGESLERLPVVPAGTDAQAALGLIFTQAAGVEIRVVIRCLIVPKHLETLFYEVVGNPSAAPWPTEFDNELCYVTMDSWLAELKTRISRRKIPELYQAAA